MIKPFEGNTKIYGIGVTDMCKQYYKLIWEARLGETLGINEPIESIIRRQISFKL